MPSHVDIMMFLTPKDVIKRAVVNDVTVLLVKFAGWYCVLQRDADKQTKRTICRTLDIKKAVNEYVETLISNI